MDLSPSAQEMRNLANRLQQISEYDTHTDTGEPDHEITTGELLRLKVALRPLVDNATQSRFMQILNKMSNAQPISTAEAQLITSAFTSMVDIIATDNGLMNRLRNDISSFNKEHEADNTTDEPEEEELEIEEPTPVDPYKLK